MTDTASPRPLGQIRPARMGADQARRLRRVQRIARLMDAQFRLPLIGRRIGLDGIVGLVPGVGDTAGLLVSAWIIAEAAQAGVPRPVLARMAANVGIDWAVGLVPLLGDIFDIGFKANLRNAAAMEAALRQGRA